MSSEAVIKLDGIGKSYRIYQRPIDRIREMYSLRGRTYHKTFSALKEINLAIERGDTLGIIGPNGSGKSTLLEIICGTLTPSTGTVAVQGRIAALLELGAGFDPAFSGRENVYINAALMGVSREEVDERFDEITEFAGVGEFIDHPVSTYSSGMYVRLAFATAINTDPDILIVDEALAVGDIRFQRKCYRRFEEFKKAGKTILFVTHSVELVQAHCSKAIYLRSGEIRAQGLPGETIQRYLDDLFGPNEAELSESDGCEEGGSVPDQARSRLEQSQNLSHGSVSGSAAMIRSPKDLLPTKPFYNGNEYRWGDRRAEIYDVEITDEGHQHLSYARPGQAISLRAKVYFKEPLAPLIFGLTVKTVDGRVAYGVNTRERGIRIPEARSNEAFEIAFTFNCSLIPGDYFISLGVALDDEGKDNVAVDRRYDVIFLPVQGQAGDFGIAALDAKMAINSVGTTEK